MLERIPTVKTIRDLLRSDYKEIRKRKYSANQIHLCLQAYKNRRKNYKKYLINFEECLHKCNRDISDAIHSVSYRTKDYSSLIDKLRRKCITKNKKERRSITISNLFDPNKGIADFGGVRILHLYKSEWLKIHNYLTSDEFSNSTGFNIFKSEAYFRKGDKPKGVECSNIRRGFNKWEESNRNYTSIHYTIRVRNTDYYLECQLRTLFEEGWGQIEHNRQYPYETTRIQSAQLALLNRVAGVADTISTSLQEQFDALPLFVPWGVELDYERSAKKVLVFSLNLRWANIHLSDMIKQIQKSKTIYEYFIPKIATQELKVNHTNIARRIHKERLNRRLYFIPVPIDKIVGLPIFSDILLLKDVVNLNLRIINPKDIAIIGTPTRSHDEHYPIRETERLDIVIDDSRQVRRMQRFFNKISN